MQMLILGTGKVVLIIVILVLIARTRDAKPLDDPFFVSQAWTLRDAYKVFIPVIIVIYIQFVVYLLVPEAINPWVPLISAPIACAMISVCYFWFIHKPYPGNASVLGLDKSKLLTAGLRHLNFAGIFLILMLPGSLGEKVSAVPFASAGKEMAEFEAGASFILVVVIIVFPILEELLFCGVLYAPVARKLGQRNAMGLLALVVALFHLHYGILASAFVYVSSLLLYAGYSKSRSLWVPIIWHISINFFKNRLYIGSVIVPQMHSATLDRGYIFGLIIGLSIMNGFKLIGFLRHRRLRKLSSTCGSSARGEVDHERKLD